MSDEENEESKNGNNTVIIELLVQMIAPIKTILDMDPLEPISTTFNQNRIVPLGKIKLRAVELLQAIVSLKKTQIITAVSESGVMASALKLIEKHPWNNMIQLKVQQIFEDALQSDLDPVEKRDFLKMAEVTTILTRMADTPEVRFASGNSIRNGQMGFVVKLSNFIIK